MGIEQGGCGETDPLALSAALVLDPRLAEVWQLVWSCTPAREESDPACSLETLGALLRLAYVQGYADAAAETVPGSLFEELGLRNPARVSSTRRSSASRRHRARARRDSSGT